MVAKLETIRKKIRNKKKLGFSERARAVNKGLLPSKAKKNDRKSKSNNKKVAGKLKKASKAHAGQAKALSALELKKGGSVKKKRKRKSKSTVNKAGNYTKPELRKRIFNRIKAGGKGGAPGQWSARKAQMMAKAYKKAGGGYRN